MDDPTTVRRATTTPGSSARRVELVDGEGPAVGMALPLPVPLPRAGERIDVFELEQAIGVGGMGAVFRALDTRLDRHVALKILPPEQAGDVEVVQRFYQEGRAAARLDHENIARVYSIGHDGRFHFIAFEYIEGTTVRQRVERNGPLPVAEAINFTLQIADALVHAAERGVVHRDIKPSNIIATPHARAKLVDMGLARRFERGGDDGLTQSGMTLGTFDYISPEQARDPRDVDVRSDLYSLGCTLFHMLTGRPPFPEGTVLQKLIQHQEEPPPDVRALNASVPAGLASILSKLMAKDRDRRYQTPEQLVRDLLTVAGALGLRSVSPEGLLWLAAETPPGWERHLVWGVPTVALALIVCVLVWWGQDPGRPAGGAAADPLPNVTVRPASPSARATSPATAGGDARGARTPAGDAGPSAAAAAAPVVTDITVDSGEDLASVIARAPRRAVIRLIDDGPYAIGGGRGGRLVGRDLTIKADAGVRPVLRPARGTAVESGGRPALLDFVGGRVTLEGLEFAPDAPGPSGTGPAAAVRAEGTELTVRRCVFRRPGGAAAPAAAGWDAVPRAAALDVSVRETGTDGERPPAVVVDRCHVSGGQTGVRASGPVDLVLRDCTLAGNDPAVWLDDGRAPVPVPAELRIKHVSVLAGKGPVFRFDGADPRVWVDDSVVSAAEGQVDATLVATDHPDALTWRGRGNLYAGIETFLFPTDGRLGREAVREPARWKESAEEVRETGTEVVALPVWDEADPGAAVAQESSNPTRAFRLAPGHAGLPGVGAREGPFGTLAPAPRLAAGTGSGKIPTPSATPAPPPRATAAPTGTTGGSPPNLVASRSEPRERESTGAARTSQPPSGTQGTAGEATPPAPVDKPGAVGDRMNELPEMPVMPPASTGAAGREGEGGEGPDATAAGGTRGESGSSPSAPSAPASGSKPSTPSAVAPPPASPASPAPLPATPSGRGEPGVLRTADQLLNALGDPDSRGGVVRVPADADWELSATVVRATGSWRVQAEPGPTRPRLRFLPGAADPKSPTAWSAMIAVRSGSLQLTGFDIILPRENTPRQGRWAAFSLGPATDLSLTNCTVTVEGNRIPSAVVAVEAGDNEVENGVNAPEPAAATVRLNDTLIRSGGDLVDVGGGRRLTLEMDDTAAATAGSLVHAHGIPRGQVAERLGLTLRQVTARAAGGLVRLESAAGEPELPVADVNARYSVLTTGAKDAPLLVVDGQDAPSSTRDRIRWEGLGVAYHDVTIYRRDQSSQVGAVPTLYDRSSWSVAVGAREKDAVHGDVKFLREPDPSRPAWSVDKDALRLGDDSPARSSGSDLARIPDPPPVS